MFVPRSMQWAIALFLSEATSSPSEDGPLPGFASPANEYRPKFRYWFPDASVSGSIIQNDIKAIKAVGGGGLQFLPFYNYGLGPPLTNWSTFGFGTPAFKTLFSKALDACVENGIKFDFALGANQGQGVPSSPETSGLAYELVYGSRAVEAGQNYNGPVPAADPHFHYEAYPPFMNPPQLWGASTLVGVVAAEISGAPGNTTILKEASATDLTSITNNGTLTWTAPEGDGDWMLFAFYERYTNQKSCVSIDGAGTILGNGSWMVDHFSAAGAKMVTDFWAKNLLDDTEITNALAKTGEYSWEDSMEMLSALWWSPGFINRFAKARGYGITKYLPIMFSVNTAWSRGAAPYNITYVFDTGATTARYVEDYEMTLNEGYLEYLQHFQQWAGSLGLSHSCQPAYNLPLDLMADVPKLVAPELESLLFNDDIDLYRQFSGAAHLEGVQVISSEIGAISGGPYSMTVSSLATLFQNSFAGGVNTFVVHGLPYSGDYAATSWPGYTPFEYNFTEMWGPRMPAWKHFNDTLLYAARNSVAAKLGSIKVDLAFYAFNEPFAIQEVYPGEDLNAAGYTHEYLGPSNLASSKAIIRDALLAPDGPAYKAIVIYKQTQITPAASAALLRFAQAGFPIFIVGQIPNTTIGTGGQSEVSSNMDNLVHQPKVQIIPVGSFVPSQLANAGVNPRATIHSVPGVDATRLYTVWRFDNTSGLNAVYLLNRGPPGTFSITFDVPGDSTPWKLDAWTGKQTPLALFHRDSSGIAINVTLAQSQTTILAFSTSGNLSMSIHALAHSQNVRAVRYNDDGNLEAAVEGADEATVSLSNGTVATISPAASPSSNTTLGPWGLVLECYLPPTQSASVQGTTSTTTLANMPTLAPWSQLPNLQDVSGIGTYTTTFHVNMTSPASSHVFLLHLGAVLDTIRVWLNGAIVDPVDFAVPTVDVSALIAQGENKLQIETAGTLFNAVKARIGSLQSAGAPPGNPSFYSGTDYAPYGLVGPVTLETLNRAALT